MCISTPRSNLVVRFLSVFLLCCTSLYASTDQTGKQKVTVIGTDVTLETVFKQIERQTGLRFMYAVDAVDVKEKVTVMFEKVMLDEVLESLLGKKGIEWVYREGVISLKRQINRSTNNYNSEPPNNPLITISGKILDVKGTPVPFATVVIKGAKKGTKADGDGLFVLTGVELNSILLVSSIGFETKEVIVRGKNIIVKMNQEIGVLGVKIVKGYYSTTGRLNTGNITTIKAEDIERQPVSDPLLTLQGRVPGMFIAQTTGLSGGKVDVQIRGKNSIANGTIPLFIVDGVPYEPNLMAPPLGVYGALSDIVSALNFINPSDIENIDILKDADATSIYGSRGANGVVLITTKKGKIGDARINVNFNKGWQSLTRRLELLNTPQYLALRRDAFKYDGEIPTSENAPDLVVWDTTRYVDWQDVLLGGTGGYMDAQANISGGSNVVQYLIGGNFHKETTAFPGDFFSQRGGAHFNIVGSSPSQRLRASLTGSYTINKSNYPEMDFARYVTLPPNAPQIYNEDGSLNYWTNTTLTNPYKQLISSILEAETNNMVTNVDVSYQFQNGLGLKVNIGYNELRTNTFSGVTIAGVDPIFRNDARASATYLNSRRKSWISEPQATYRRAFGRSNLDALIGVTLLGNSNDGQNVRTRGILQDALIKFPAAATSYSVRGNGSKYKYAAVFGRIGYNLLDKYLVNATIRRDGSSRFGPRKQFANFWSLGAAWIFSEESYIRKNLSVLSFGKLRASYGITGNDQIGDYQYLDQYLFVEQPYQGEKGLRVNGVYNRDFGWEKTGKAEGGIELGFFRDKILLSTSYYKNISNNQLLPYPLPVMTGGTVVTGNLPATVYNSGIEFMLTTRNIKSDKFIWTSVLNFSSSRNRLVKTAGFDPGIVGQSLSSLYLYEQLGVDPTSGAYLFADSQGKPTTVENGADPRRKIVDLSPSFFGGLQNSFQYKGFQLDIFFQYVKQKGANGLFSSLVLPGTLNNVSTAMLSRWEKVGDNTQIQRANQNYNLAGGYYAWLTSDKAYGNASFIRCKNVSLSWKLPDGLSQQMHIGSCSIYLQCQNLFTITKYKGWDPETRTMESIPPLRVITSGIQVAL